MTDSGPDLYDNYRALLAKVDAHHAEVARSVPMRCNKGCSACCHVDLTVCRVEADFIARDNPTRARRYSPGVLDDHSLFGTLAVGSPCVYLNEEAACTIYDVRPLICRSHGVPVRAEGRVDICPLNGEMGGAPELNLALLNTLLAAINDLYCRQVGVSAERIPLSDLGYSDSD